MHHRSHEVRGHKLKRDLEDIKKSEDGSIDDIKLNTDIKTEKNSDEDDEAKCENPEESQQAKDEDEGLLGLDYSPPR